MGHVRKLCAGGQLTTAQFATIGLHGSERGRQANASDAYTCTTLDLLAAFARMLPLAL